MSQLSPADRRFLEQRRLRTHVGMYLLPAALGAIVALWVGLFAWWPIAVNSRHAWSFFEGRMIPAGTVTTYAITVTVLVNVLLLVLCVALLIGILWARSERRYLKVLAQLERGASPEPAVTAQSPAQSSP